VRTREKLSRRLKAQQPCEDRTLLLTAILADAINLGITKMAEACPGTIARKLDWLASLHIRDETYALAIVELVNHHHRHAFAEHWGEGKTSSSDGQRFRASGRGEAAGHVNLRYGNEPATRTFRTNTRQSTAR
jgi:TnpA family transposase